MAKLSEFERQQTWGDAETYLKLHLSKDKFYHYSHEWPERLTVNELTALQAMNSDSSFMAWKYLISNSGMPVIVDSVRTVAGSGERSKERNCSASGSWVFPIIFEAPNMELETISPSDFAEFLKQKGEQPSECIRYWFDAFGVEYVTPDETVTNGDVNQEAATEPASVKVDTTPKPSTKQEVFQCLTQMVKDSTRLHTLLFKNDSKTKWLAECKLGDGYNLPMVIKAHSTKGLLKDEYQLRFSEDALTKTLSVNRP